MSDHLSEELPIGAALAAWVAQRCGLEPEAVDRDCPLVEFGLSSVDAVELAGRIEDRLHRPVPATLLWEYPTINAIERGLRSRPAIRPAAPGRPRTDASPIAVVGVGCRFPGGADGPEALWRLLLSGRDAVRTVPPDRWPGVAAVLGTSPGAAPSAGSAAPQGTAGAAPAGVPPSASSAEAVLGGPGRWGGFLDDVARFDAEFFGITPGEARLMDPQQRLLLEVAWDALAHAALDPAGLRGSLTGVYVGICASEYAHLTTAALSGVEGWTATGGALSIAANRLSYLLDLRGPSLAVDTACSSSLVAIHLAACDLRSGETDLALAAGVNLLLDPALTVAFGRAGGLGAGGRCRPFDEAADGIVRGEGCGVVVLKRLADALRDRDRVLAVLRGGAVNSDGRSNGLVAPNPQAQEALLRRAYADSDCDPSTVDYVEAHGTGTPLGDPIEAGALGAVCGTGRPGGRPLLIGSVKSHLGHLEAAAGVAGFITAVLALHHGTVPPTIHATRTNPRIPLAEWGLRVATAAQPLPSGQRPARVGVSAFGFGGTNAHLVLEAAPPPAGRTSPPGGRPPWTGERPAVCVVADRDPARVREQAAALARWLPAHPEADPAGVAGTLARRGERGPARAAVVARDRAELVAGLGALSSGRIYPGTAEGAGRRAAGPGVWVFSGYGAHWPGMGAALLEEEPAFADAVDELEPAFRAEVGVSLRDGLAGFGAGTAGGAAGAPVVYAQPLTFGLQVALAELWRAYGVEPGAVIGHSMGEVAAAVVAGALSPREGIRVIASRARLLATVGPGAMAVVDLSEEDFSRVAAGLPEVSVAVVAAPGQLVVTGPSAAVDALAARVTAGGGAVRTVTTEGAGHSPAVDPLLDPLREALRDLRPAWPRVPFYSTATSGPPVLDAEYWVANLRRPVRLADAVRLAAADGFGLFLEISPHPVLVRPLGQTLAAAGVPDALVTGTLRRGDGTAFRRGLATLCAHGHRVPALAPARILDLPTPPWRGGRYWFEPNPRAAREPVPAPLPGEHVEVPGEDRHVWRLANPAGTGRRLVSRTPDGVDTLPLAGLVELAIAAATQATGARPEQVEVVDAAVEAAGAYQAETALTTTLVPAPPAAWEVAVHAPSVEGGWVCLGRARVHRLDDGAALPVPEAPPAQRLPVAAGPDALAACFAAFAHVADGWTPVRAGTVRVGSAATAGGQCHIWLEETGREQALPDGALTGSWRGGRLRLLDADGVVLLAADGVVLHRAEPGDARPSLLRRLIGVAWREQEPPASAAALRDAVTVLAAPGDDLAAAVLADPAAPAGSTRAQLTDAQPARDAQPAPDAQPARDAQPAPDAGLAGAQAGGAGAGRRDVVLIAPPAGPVPDPAAAQRLALAAARAAAAAGTRRLWLVTRGAAALGGPGAPDLAWARGLVRTLAFEQPSTRATWLDLDPAGEPAAQAAQLWRELHGGGGDDEIAWRGGRRWAGRLVPVAVPARRPGRPVRAGAAYVITGGYGGIGLRVARWLASAGAGRLVLSGRSGPGARDAASIEELRRAGTQVCVVLGDIAGEGVAERLVATACAGGVPLAGVVHAAGVLRDRLLPHVGPQDLAEVWAPKVDGAWRLHAAVATAGAELDWWISFSSAAALLGSPGQVAYATANAWLDAFAGWQRAQGLPASAVNWGTWSQVGGATGVHLPGLDPIEPDEGIAALAGLACRSAGTVGVLRFDPGPALAAFPEAGRLPFFAELAGDLPPGAVPAGDGAPDWGGPQQLRTLPAADALRLIGERLAYRITMVLGTDRVPPRDAPLTDIGLDSLAAIRIKSLAEADFGCALPTSTLVGGATLADLEVALGRELGVAVAGAATPPPGAGTAPPVAGATPPPGAGSAPPGAGTAPPPAAVAESSGAAPVVGARDAAERAATRLFEAVLGRPVLDIETRLPRDAGDTRVNGSGGGGERLARQIVEAARREYGVHLDLAALLTDPTPRALAVPLRAAEQAEVSAGGPVRALRIADGTQPPLFLGHPAGGTTHVYRQLVELLDPDQTVYGLERFADGGSVPERAARYVRLIREVCATGPYRLGGWSFGGVLAFEMARQLAAGGEKVDRVVLLDSGLPVPVPPDEAAALLTERFLGFVAYLRGTYRAHVEVDAARLRGLTEDEQFELVLAQMSAAGLVDRLPPAVWRHQVDSHRDTRALDGYEPGPYGGPVTLYRATQPTPWAVRDRRYEHTDAARGWDRFCSDLRIVPVAGHHLNLLDPPAVSAIAADLRRLL